MAAIPWFDWIAAVSSPGENIIVNVFKAKLNCMNHAEHKRFGTPEGKYIQE